jgi:hypothetical protein
MTPVSETPITDFFVKWTPRAIAATVGGYYGLGIAYELGFMALIDQVAIQILKNIFGYAGIGALMPTVQWYAAWAAQLTIALGCGLLYDLTEKCAKYVHEQMTHQPVTAAPV